MTETQKALLKTIVYYDSFDYPLTLDELRTYLFSNSENLDILPDLDKLKVQNLIEEADGFYFLTGRDSLIRLRKGRSEIAKKKWKIALRAAKWLKLVPYIRLVFASGSLALKNTAKESDLDFLLIAKHGRIWTARSLAVFLLNLLGLLRRKGQKTAPDKVCLNHFITDRSLYIPRKSIYTAQLYARLVPIWKEDKKLIDDFCEVNQWVGDYVPKWRENPNFQFTIFNQFSYSNFQNFIRKIGEKILDTKFGDWLENIFRRYNLHRIKNDPLTYKPGGRVKADDESLEFHPDSQELKIIERYNKKMVELGFPELAKESDSGLTKI